VTRRQWKLRGVHADARRKSYSVSFRSVSRKQSLNLDGPRCRDLMLPLFPLFLFLEDVLWSLISLSTVIFDIVVIMEWTIPNESRIYRIHRRGPYPKKSRRVLLVTGQFTTVKYRSEQDYPSVVSWVIRESDLVSQALRRKNPRDVGNIDNFFLLPSVTV
jgi:hypothetical protein